ncbi:MAG: type I glyceraldehyde-3-phosphate dehydrogenase [Armatimonadota bacterium]|nr:type I glyceraldehyde-3-phosphate dehydrogenase [Armatimonadota bacterium]MDR7562532.1 type I glyceraldehyde-3-phosphate dehydrogenase [Armatimonadota bacterium]MDR7566866.1 type I glyceraldehyde-3-phosphate dehydrogenase [Armatimonadota bacterium]MDR7601416.1 type I glyceraldehyde-3-phosphate dehydrogenase [Armatimonadota bacterium]
MVRVGINGFGRIGRQALKAMLQRAGDVLEVVAINDLVDAEMNAYLFKYDSNYGVYPGTVTVRNGNLVIDGREIRVFREREPGAIPWREVGVELVLESTGLFTDAKKAAAHLEAGAKRVIISAPARNEDITIVLGVNEDQYDPARHRIVSNASCTTNGLAPVARVLHEEFGIEKGILTTVHAYTNTQRLLDVAAREMRDARAAALNIVPSETGAARAVGLVIPDLHGKFTGMAFRVPTSTVSVIDFTILLRRDVTRDEINAVMKRWSEERMPEILGYTEEPLVSSDLKGDPRSSIFSAPDTLVVGGNLAKVVSWYDNEWGYACRCADLAKLMAQRGI